MRIDIITLFPELFTPFFQYGICGRAVKREKIFPHYWNPRHYAKMPHRIVDDKPYGGGSGMVMMAEPLMATIKDWEALHTNAQRIYLTPRGEKMNDTLARKLATNEGIIFLCGRYRGIDERAVSFFSGQEISIGDYVLSGGEVAAMAIMEAVIRHIPNVLGNADSTVEEAFVDDLLDAPCYTRPATLSGQAVPEVLLSGNHEEVNHWRLQMRQKLTAQNRPDLLKINHRRK